MNVRRDRRISGYPEHAGIVRMNNTAAQRGHGAGRPLTLPSACLPRVQNGQRGSTGISHNRNKGVPDSVARAGFATADCNYRHRVEHVDVAIRHLGCSTDKANPHSSKTKVRSSLVATLNLNPSTKRS